MGWRVPTLKTLPVKLGVAAAAVGWVAAAVVGCGAVAGAEVGGTGAAAVVGCGAAAGADVGGTGAAAGAEVGGTGAAVGAHATTSTKTSANASAANLFIFSLL
jgi:hypothetical protein